MSTNNNWVESLCGRQRETVMAMIVAQTRWAESKGLPYQVHQVKWVFSTATESKPQQLGLIWQTSHPNVGPAIATNGIRAAWPGDAPAEMLANVEIQLQ